MWDLADDLLLLGGVGVDTVDLDDRRALGEVRGDDDRNSLHLPDLLDLVAGGSHLQAFEDGPDLGLGEEPLLGGLHALRFAGALEDDLVLVILVEQGLLVVDRTRSNLHLQRVLFCVLLHLLEMLIIAVLSKPRDNVALGPVDLEGMLMLVVDVVLEGDRSAPTVWAI